VLDGIDDIDWAGLRHVYGAGSDVPEMLRALASDDPAEAEEGFEWAVSSLYHQGDSCSAAAAAMPFLIELAGGAAHERARITHLLGRLADPQAITRHDGDFAATRDALRRHLAGLIPLLADDDMQVRENAAYAVAQAGDASALLARLAVELAPEVRGSLLLGLGLVDPAGSAGLLLAGLDDPAAVVRTSAAIALVRSGRRIPVAARDGLAEAVAEAPQTAQAWMVRDSALSELAELADADTAPDLLGKAVSSPDARVRRRGVWAAAQRNDASRSAPPWTVELLRPLLSDPDAYVSDVAAKAFADAGPAARPYADELAGIAAGYPAVAGAVSLATPQLMAVAALIRLGDPRWVDPVCDAWAVTHPKVIEVQLRIPCPQPVLSALRRRLGSAGGDRRMVEGVARLLARIGPAAGDAEPELLAALPVSPGQVLGTLLRLNRVSEALLPHLRAATLDHDVTKAVGLWRITGDRTPVADAVRRHVEHDAGQLNYWLPPAYPAGEGLSDVAGPLRAVLADRTLAAVPARGRAPAVARKPGQGSGRAHHRRGTDRRRRCRGGRGAPRGRRRRGRTGRAAAAVAGRLAGGRVGGAGAVAARSAGRGAAADDRRRRGRLPVGCRPAGPAGGDERPGDRRPAAGPGRPGRAGRGAPGTRQPSVGRRAAADAHPHDDRTPGGRSWQPVGAGGVVQPDHPRDPGRVGVRPSAEEGRQRFAEQDRAEQVVLG